MKSIRPPAMIISVRFGHDTQRQSIGDGLALAFRQPKQQTKVKLLIKC
jgi:hypothetical protein